MKSTAFTVAIGITTCLLAIAVTCASATTNVVEGTFMTQVSGRDCPGLVVIDEKDELGTWISCLRLKTFHYPDYTADPVHQDIYDFLFSYDPYTFSFDDYTDEDGNVYRYSYWGSPNDPYPGTIYERLYILTNTFTADLENALNGMSSFTSFPIAPGLIPPQFERYLEPGPYTQSNHEAIVAHANSLVAGCSREFQAVARIIDWCVDNITYTLPAPQHDALWILYDPTHRAQCAGYSHMAIALLKAVGIPARYVSGFSIDKPYFIPGPSGGWTYNHGQGTHAWLEVYYPDVGWIPYDAQRFYQYVDTHVYKGSVGIDTDNRYPTEGDYSYWSYDKTDPTLRPIVGWASTWESSVVDPEINALQYSTTYETPDEQAFADRLDHCTPICIHDEQVTDGFQCDTLRWTDDCYSFYTVYRSDHCWGPYREIAQVSGAGTNYHEYVDCEVQYSRPYWYMVNDTPFGSAVPQGLEQPDPPGIPTGLVASNVPADCGHGAWLDWEQGDGTPPDSYLVFRSLLEEFSGCSGDPDFVASTTTTASEYLDETVPVQGLYSYSVVAWRPAGVSEGSQSDSVMVVRELTGLSLTQSQVTASDNITVCPGGDGDSLVVDVTLVDCQRSVKTGHRGSN